MKKAKKPRREYRLLDGVRVPGTTTIIGEGLAWKTPGLQKYSYCHGVDALASAVREAMPDSDEAWVEIVEQTKKARADLAHTRRAADAGTVAHEMCEAFDETGSVDDVIARAREQYGEKIVARAERGLEGYLEWVDTHAVQTIENEIALVSEEHRFGGTLDKVAIVDGRWALVDLKTGRGVYDEMSIQLGAYWHLWSENRAQTPLEDAFILHISNETAEFSVHAIKPSALSAGWMVFKHLRAIYDLRSGCRIEDKRPFRKKAAA